MKQFGAKQGEAGKRVLPNLEAQRRVAEAAYGNLVRALVILVGLGLFVGAQVGIASLINDISRLWIFLVGALCLAFVAAGALFKPTHTYIAWLALSPLVYFFFTRDFGQGLPPISLDRIAIPLLSFSLLIRTMANRRQWRMPSWAECLLIGFVLWSLFNLVFIHGERDTGLIGKNLDYVFLAGVLYFVTKAAMKEKRHISWAFVTIMAVGFISAATLIIEAHTGYSWAGWILGRKIALTWSDIGQGRGQGLWYIPHVSQIFCAMTAFLAFHYSQHTKSFLAKIALYTSMLVMIFAIYYAYSRTGYVALAILLLMMPATARQHRARYALLSGATVVVILLSLPILYSNKEFSKRMASDTVTIRYAINETNLALIKDNLWAGVGYGRVPSAFWKYVANWEHRNSLKESNLSLGRPNNPHNWHLQVIGEEGLVGAVFCYGSILAFLIMLLRISNRLPSHGVLNGNLAAVVLVATVSNVIVQNFYGGPKVPYPIYVFWIVLALIVRLGEITRDEECAIKTQSDSDTTGRSQPRRFARS